MILLPHSVRYVFLSATIPNALQFAEWIAALHSQPCHVVRTVIRISICLLYVYVYIGMYTIYAYIYIFSRVRMKVWTSSPKGSPRCIHSHATWCAPLSIDLSIYPPSSYLSIYPDLYLYLYTSTHERAPVRRMDRCVALTAMPRGAH